MIRFVDRLREARLLRLFDLWRAARDDAGIVPRDRLGPDALGPDLLPFIFIHERRHGRWFCRLAGTRLRDAFGHEASGRFLDEMPGLEILRDREALCDRVLETGHPALIAGLFLDPGQNLRRFRSLLLPVAHGQVPNQAMGATVFQPAETAFVRGAAFPTEVETVYATPADLAPR